MKIIINFFIDKKNFFYFIFFDCLYIFLLCFDLSRYEKHLFNFFEFISKKWHTTEIEEEKIFSLVHYFKILNTIKIYILIIEYIKNITENEYKQRNEKSFEIIKPDKIMIKIKDKLTFTNRMHLILIRRYFMSLLFIILSLLIFEFSTVSHEKKKAMDYFLYNLNIQNFDKKNDEILKFLYSFSNIQKNKNEYEYLLAIQFKKNLKKFIQKKEILINKKKIILWNFTNLSNKELKKFQNFNNLNYYNINDVIILDKTIKSLDDIKFYEMKKYISKDYIFYMNIKKSTQKTIKKKIILKVFIIMFSIIILIYFTNELDVILFPVEGILKKLKLMKINPTLALEMQEELLNNELNIIKNKNNKKNTKDIYEILKMEENLMKLGTIMLLGFGEAGAKIISKNINEQQKINLLINGEIVYAVFSFCDIRNFTEITEILKEKIMIFINLIAEIVHECCDYYGGSINKNIGDAFLLVWKCKKKNDINNFENDFFVKNYSFDKNISFDKNNSFDTYSNEYLNRVCDLAFLSTIHTLIKIQQSEKIFFFFKNENLNLFSQKNFSLQLSFGLHFGWAIEGPIGSIYKIDLSYFSENVNIASRLQDICKLYNTNIIISDDFYKNMSNNFKKLLRRIDKVTLKGCTKPINIYTFDFDLNKIKQKYSKSINKDIEISDNKIIVILDHIKKKEIRKKRKKEIFNQSYNIYDEYLKMNEISFIRINYPQHYLILYEKALDLYLNGKWIESKNILDDLKKTYSYEDNITDQLFNFMNSKNFIKPINWYGYRQFEQKC